MALDAFALDVFERGAQVFAPAFDGTQERRKCQPADIGVAGALAFARHAFFEIGEFLFDVGFHAVERRHAPFEIVDAESAQTEQRVLSVS